MMRAGQIRIEGECALKRSLREVEIGWRIVLEFVQKSRRAPEPCPSGRERWIRGDAHRKQVACPLHGVERFELGKLLRAQKRLVGRVFDAGFTDDGDRESV